MVTFWEFKGWWDHPKIYMIAPPWKDNQKDISCIPQGLYNVIRHNSIYHPNTFEILNVPSREGVLIHPGNYACPVQVGDRIICDSKGCFLPGFDYDKKTPMIKRSVKAQEYLLDNIKDNFALEVKFMPSMK
jgi:hypothetical protein